MFQKNFPKNEHYCIVPQCSVTFWTHPEIIPVGQFFRRWNKSINQSIDQEWRQMPTTMVEALRSRSFRLIDWLIEDKLTLTWLAYWIRTTRCVFTGAGLKLPNTAGQYNVLKDEKIDRFKKQNLEGFHSQTEGPSEVHRNIHRRVQIVHYVPLCGRTDRPHCKKNTWWTNSPTKIKPTSFSLPSSILHHFCPSFFPFLHPSLHSYTTCRAKWNLLNNLPSYFCYDWCTCTAGDTTHGASRRRH